MALRAAGTTVESTAGLTTSVGMALAAAFLNAAFGLCLGCEMYLLIKRISGRRTSVSL